MDRVIYADHAATTMLSPRALDAMTSYMHEDYANASQPYSFARLAKRRLKEARTIVAECIGAKPHEIFFTSGGTESDNWVILNALFNHWSVITSQIEHHAILNACKAIELAGAVVIYLPVDENGLLNPHLICNTPTPSPALVSVMTANNEIGTIMPIAEIAEIAHSKGAIFHTDAVQAVGHIDIDVNSLGVDMLSASAHKFNGPKGTGFLFIREGIPMLPLINGGAQESGMRAGTENIAAIIGMAEALKENCAQIRDTTLKIKSLEDVLLSELSKAKIDFVRNGRNQLPGNISLSFKGQTGEGLMHRMDLKKIMVSTGSACDSVNTNVSHVLRAIGLEDEYARGTIRISLGKENTEEEVTHIASALISIMSSQIR